MLPSRVRTSVLRAPVTRTLFARYETTAAAPDGTASSDAASSGQEVRKYRPSRPGVLIPRTHFLSIPLYEDSPDLRPKLSAFRDSLVAAGLKGFTAETVYPRLSQFLELRLGNLNIAGFQTVVWQQRRPPKGVPTTPTRAEQTPIPLDEMVEVLQGLKPSIQEILNANGGDGAIHVPLGNLRPLMHGPRKRFNHDKVNILFLEPSDLPKTEALRAVNELIFKRFDQAGFWVDTRRCSTLTLTVANARYQKDFATKSYEERVHFSVKALYESEVFRAVEAGPPIPSQNGLVDYANARPVNLGEGIARSIHIVPIKGAKPGASEEEDMTVGADDPVKPDFKLEF